MITLNKTLSIVIPTIGRSVLDLSIASVLKQSVAPYELIVWDNSGTGKAQKESMYALHPQVKWYKSDERVPITSSWNTAVSLTSGEYVYILGDDDLMLPDFVRQVTAELNNGAELIHVKCRMINEHGEEAAYPVPFSLPGGVYCAERFISGVIDNEVLIFLSALVFARSQFEKVGRFRDIVINGLAMDVLFNIEVTAALGSITVIDNPLWLYRSMVSDWCGTVKKKSDVGKLACCYRQYRNYVRKIFDKNFPGLWTVFHRKMLIQQMVTLAYNASPLRTFMISLHKNWSISERYYILRDWLFLFRHRK